MSEDVKCSSAETPLQKKRKVYDHDDGRATMIMICPCGKYGEITTNKSNLPGFKPCSYISSMISFEGIVDYLRYKRRFEDDESRRRYVRDVIRYEERGMPESLIDRHLKTRGYGMSNSVPTDSIQQEGHLCRWIKYANISDQYSQTCGICLEDYKSGDKIAMLYYCFHEYHVDCIKGWLRRKNLCPTCKQLAITPRNFDLGWKGDNIRHHQLYFDEPSQKLTWF